MELIAFLLVIVFLPLLIGYGRCLDDWRMMQIYLWYFLPVLGWFVALYVALKSED